jgi:hypothetical protein
MWSPVRVVCLTVLAWCGASTVAAAMCIDVSVRSANDRPTARMLAAMRQEAAAIWRRYGVDLQWASEPGNPRCVVVHGTIQLFVDQEDHTVGRQDTPVLGRADLVIGTIHDSPVHIDAYAVRHILESMFEDDRLKHVGHRLLFDADIGRALGRVLAHELGHLILGITGHQKAGLMRAEFTPGDLLGHQPDLCALSRGEIVRLHQRTAQFERQIAAFAPDPGADWRLE